MKLLIQFSMKRYVHTPLMEKSIALIIEAADYLDSRGGGILINHHHFPEYEAKSQARHELANRAIQTFVSRLSL